MRVLCLSNGHGEDAIATRILRQLRATPNPPELSALSLVGEGQAYRHMDIPLIGPVKAMPSGGFVYMEGRQLAKDVKAGMLQLLWQQYQAIRSWAKDGGSVLAVGDIIPLLLAWLSDLPYGFVATAKSEYWIRDENGPLTTGFAQGWSGSVYLPWERWLMARRRCIGVFPRDRLTAQTLQQWQQLPVFDCGNPMMDDLLPVEQEPEEEEKGKPLALVLLPGSRAPEAYENWQVLLTALGQVMGEPKPFPGLHRPIRVFAAIAPGIGLETFGQILESFGWRRKAPPEGMALPSPETLCYTLSNGTLFLTENAYNCCLQQAHFALAMAGTATEQFVGLGKPALTFPGKGPQFTSQFAQVQAKLLGPSVIPVKSPQAVAQTLQDLLHNPDRLQLIYANGRRRMGEPGASQRIATGFLEKISAQSG
ncbi:lipid-A-disaccharide synthase-related protein [Roseofilum sp. Guam]|uniref:lipid-A-disaccharide synthase-related protein n=1 Tax=Roseofilum sp. Guam TaxID=2821502 RepID=UPI001B045BEA|nr:lipid-A-disaccharide synthase-related protein [Roseofilum sp. Guam]MBP0026862.1 lipid-A-disaccharide synthase-related protein [Roseofilum sp. Guam]